MIAQLPQPAISDAQITLRNAQREPYFFNLAVCMKSSGFRKLLQYTAWDNTG